MLIFMFGTGFFDLSNLFIMLEKLRIDFFLDLIRYEVL
jgi:hypothetical protein